MKRGFRVEGFILFVAVIFLVLAAFIYIKKDDTQFQRYAENSDDIKISQKRILEESKTFAETTVTMLADLNKRLDAVEKTKPEQTVNFHLKEPLQVEIVYKLPDAPPQIAGKTPLLHRAGIPPKENN